MTTKLPQKFYDSGRQAANDTLIFGVPLVEFTHDELLAIAANGWLAERRARDNFASTAEIRANAFCADMKHIRCGDHKRRQRSTTTKRELAYFAVGLVLALLFPVLINMASPSW